MILGLCVHLCWLLCFLQFTLWTNLCYERWNKAMETALLTATITPLILTSYIHDLCYAYSYVLHYTVSLPNDPSCKFQSVTWKNQIWELKNMLGEAQSIQGFSSAGTVFYTWIPPVSIHIPLLSSFYPLWSFDLELITCSAIEYPCLSLLLFLWAVNLSDTVLINSNEKQDHFDAYSEHLQLVQFVKRNKSVLSPL